MFRGMSMNRVTRGVAVIACATALMSCASKPPAEPTAPAADKPVVSPAAVAAAYATSTGTVPTANSTQVAPPPFSDEVSLYGYIRLMKDDKEVYCRREVTTGTHFKKEVCISRDEVLRQHKSGDNFLRQFGAGRNLPPEAGN
jgi:hypothetical protein